MRDSGAADAQQLRQCFLRQREQINSIRTIVDVKKPARQAGFDGMQCIAGRRVLELRQQRHREDLHHGCDCGAAMLCCQELRRRDLQRGPGYADDRRRGRGGCAKR